MPDNPDDTPNELLPCPFCGSKDIQLWDDVDKLGVEPTIHYLECQDCPSTSMSFLNYEKMIKHWNTRTQCHSHPKEEIE